MCTSFAVYSKEPVYGLNFDHAEVETRLAMEPTLRLPFVRRQDVFLLSYEQNGEFIPVAGMNSRGLLVAVQEVNHGRQRPSDEAGAVDAQALGWQALRKARQAEDLLKQLGSCPAAFPPGPARRSLWADASGQAVLVEEGQTAETAGVESSPFRVVTTFPGIGAETNGATERQQIAEELIRQHLTDFGLEQGWQVLQQVARTRGPIQTRLSLLFFPNQRVVYVEIGQDFRRIWKAWLDLHILTDFAGISKAETLKFGMAGILAADLEGRS